MDKGTQISTDSDKVEDVRANLLKENDHIKEELTKLEQD